MGVALIVLSIVASYLLLNLLNQTTQVYIARETLLPGDSIETDDLASVEVNLASSNSSYLSVGSLEPGTIATRLIGHGELVPTAALGRTSAVTGTKIIVSAAASLPEETPAGTSVDVWATRSDEFGMDSGNADIVVSGATLVAVLESDGYGSDNVIRIELQVPRGSLRSLVLAIGAGDTFIVVPTVSQAGVR